MPRRVERVLKNGPKNREKSAKPERTEDANRRRYPVRIHKLPNHDEISPERYIRSRRDPGAPFREGVIVRRRSRYRPLALFSRFSASG
jgi:hypothetical protein